MAEQMAAQTAGAAPSQGVMARLFKRKLVIFGLFLILVIVGGAVFAPLIAPYAPDKRGDGNEVR